MGSNLHHHPNLDLVHDPFQDLAPLSSSPVDRDGSSHNVLDDAVKAPKKSLTGAAVGVAKEGVVDNDVDDGEEPSSTSPSNSPTPTPQDAPEEN
jgi:hypothetical protein